MVSVKQQKLLDVARDRFSALESAEHHNRVAALDDLRFVYNIDEGQWPQEIREERERDGRPCLTSNKLRKFVAQVANRERDQRVAGRVRPVDDKADPVIAEIIAGIIRQIENASDADAIYAEAGEYAVASGSGYWRLTTEVMQDSFDQEVFIRRIENPFSVYKDPQGDYCFVREAMTRDKFNEKYPKFAKEQGFDGEAGTLGEDFTLWYENDKIFVAEYFYKKYMDMEIAEVIHPLTQQSWVVEVDNRITRSLLMSEGFEIIRTRKGRKHEVRWAKITGNEVLEEGEWPGREIPVIEVKGDHINVSGKIYKRSLIRDAKDPQRMYNYSLTHNTEVVALQPKAPYLVTQKQVEGHERMWNQVNKKNLSYVLFNGRAVDKPRREPPPQISPGASALMGFAVGDIQDTIGLFEASFGEKSNERTGVAIKQRANRSDFSTFHFSDNYKRAIMETTRHLIDIIPKIYDAERVQRITGEDGSEMLVMINHQAINPLNPGEALIINDLNYGKYDVVEGVKLWSTRRQEQEEAMITFASGAPNIAPLLLPEIARAQDWPGARELAAKIEAFLPALMGIKGPSQGGIPPTGGGGG